MLSAYPYFDAVPLIGAKPGKPFPAKISKGTTARLFREHGIRLVPEPMRAAPRWLNRLLPYSFRSRPCSKTPVGALGPGGRVPQFAPRERARVSSGCCSASPTSSSPTISRDAIDYALASKAYTRGSEKYLWYAQLLESMRRGNPSFLGPTSKRYATPADLAAAGLTWLALDR